MPRYVVLQHQTVQRVHFDLMLEADGVLKTWSMPQAPLPGVVIECNALVDHRLAYLDYEGPISGDRGSVTRWDRGYYTLERRSDRAWQIDLAGEKLHGAAQLDRLGESGDRWSFLLRDQESEGRRAGGR